MATEEKMICSILVAVEEHSDWPKKKKIQRN
jgi:hypothetical protein